MEKRRLKQKKEDLMEVQRRVVAYARRKKNPLYVLGDGFLTLVAAFYIFIEEAIRFVRYRLSFEDFLRSQGRCTLVSCLDSFDFGLYPACRRLFFEYHQPIR